MATDAPKMSNSGVQTLYDTRQKGKAMLSGAKFRKLP
ncbi:MAG: hypothetical protein ACI932_001236, partial [Paracoccaceae bacterium]